MNIKNVKIADITPYNKNAKKHDKTQIANVAESIKQYGFVQPVVIDSEGVIVIGHCRVLAAKKLDSISTLTSGKMNRGQTIRIRRSLIFRSIRFREHAQDLKKCTTDSRKKR